MFPKWICFLILILSVPTAAYPQTIAPKKEIDRTAIPSIDQSQIDEYYRNMRSANRKNAPRIILVPGILGSKIEACRSDGSQCKPIWGTVSAITDRGADLNIRDDRVYRTDVVESLLFKDIYGEILEYVRERADRIGLDTRADPLLSIFHYDWRLSNADNAALLREKICELRNRAPNSPLYLIAHSMGGLILKAWGKYYSGQGCPNGSKPTVQKLVFVATPHLGSPKTIKAIADGYNLLFDELEGLKRYIGWFEQNYLLAALNQSGMSFPSLYELLPIHTSQYCRSVVPALTKLPNAVEGDDGNILNLFDAAVWQRYDLLRRVGTPALRQVYYTSKLADLLRKAEKMACDMVEFDPATVADVTYFVGREKEDKTFGWFRLTSRANNALEKFSHTHGDGTVPVYSAQNFLKSHTHQTTELQAGHVEIINNLAIRSLVSDWYSEASLRSKTNVGGARPEFEKVLVAETAASGNLLPVALDARKWSTNDQKLAIAINSRALELMGYAPVDVAKWANTVPDTDERARLFAVAASSADGSAPQRLAWTSEAARYSYVSARYEEAIGSSQAILDAISKDGKPDDPNAKVLANQAKEVMGWAHLRKGDVNQFNGISRELAVAGYVLKEPKGPDLWFFDIPGRIDTGGKSPFVYYQAAKRDPTSWGSDWPRRF